MSPTPTAAPTKLSKPSAQEIRIERIFNAPRDLVWRAFTDPEWISQWWGRGNKLVVEKLEVKRGGHWRFVEHADGQVHGFEGRFREVTPPSRIAMTFEWDGMPAYPIVQTLDLEDIDGERTKMIATMLFYKEEERDGMLNSGMEGGMNQSYAALDALLARAQQ